MHRYDTLSVAIAIAMLTTSCSDDSERTDAGAVGTREPLTDSGTTATTTTITTTTLTTSETTVDTESDQGTETKATVGGTDMLDTGAGAGTSTDTDTDTDADTTVATADDGTTSGTPFGTLPHEEPFEGPEGAPWPAPWVEAGTAVLSATLDHGRGRLTGETGQVARMVLPGFTESDVDVTITVQFDDWTQQGFGLYVRQNGGALQETEPPGQGYATYVEGGFMQSIGIWRETNGVEELLAAANVPGGALQAGVPYRVRVQCLQQGASTHLRTRLWPEGEPEPEAWHVELLDDTAVLQGVTGSFALDVYNYEGNGGVFVDELQANPL